MIVTAHLLLGTTEHSNPVFGDDLGRYANPNQTSGNRRTKSSRLRSMRPSVLETEYTKKKKSHRTISPCAAGVVSPPCVTTSFHSVILARSSHQLHPVPSERRLRWLVRPSVTYGVVAQSLPVSRCRLWACVAVLQPPSCLANTVQTAAQRSDNVCFHRQDSDSVVMITICAFELSGGCWGWNR